MAVFATHLRRLVAGALVALAATAVIPAAASAAQPATLRLLAIEPSYGSVTVTTPGGARIAADAGLMSLRVTPSGGSATTRPGFCVDLRHTIGEGRDYEVSMRTAADDAALASPRAAAAGWLIQEAQSLIAAAPSTGRALEAGALQLAVWQLAGEAREASPTGDAALDARAAALRALAEGRAVGGPVAVAPEMSRGCAGRGVVRLRLTGVPGSVATVSVGSGDGQVSPAEVRFDAEGTASATVSSATPGAVAVRVRSAGGTLTRLARARAGQTTPQETMVVVPRDHVATASVVFEDCPLIPLEEDTGTPVGPGSPPSAPDPPLTPFETPTSAPPAAATPPSPVVPPAGAVPHRPTQGGPRLSLTKRGPARVRAGDLAVYVIRVGNRGSAPVTGLAVTDLLPEGMSLASVPPGARLRAGRLVWTLGTLRPRETRTLRVRVRMDADIGGRRCNRATVSAGGRTARTARACTRVISVPRTLLPAVTS